MAMSMVRAAIITEGRADAPAPKRIALFGGAFDPIHRGHVETALFLAEQDFVDEVWVLPCYRHRFDKTLTSAPHRLAMAALALPDRPKVSVSDFEVRNRLSGATWDLFAALERDFDPRLFAFHFVIGQDNANGIETWTRAPELLRKAAFLVVPRAGIAPREGPAWYEKAPHRLLRPGDRIPEGSSSRVREILKELAGAAREKDFETAERLARNVTRRIPLPVFDYIRKEGLYGLDRAPNGSR